MKYYIVKYSTGSYDDYCEIDIFITNKKSTATKYVTKFNAILKKWNEYYKQYEDKRPVMNWIKDEFVEKYFSRWHSLRKTNKCFYDEIEIRE